MAFGAFVYMGFFFNSVSPGHMRWQEAIFHMLKTLIKTAVRVDSVGHCYNFLKDVSISKYLVPTNYDLT